MNSSEPINFRERLLNRFDAIGQSLSASGQALALIGLGSVGTETAALLPQFIQGYDRNIESAKAILTFLVDHFEVNAAIQSAILDLGVSIRYGE